MPEVFAVLSEMIETDALPNDDRSEFYVAMGFVEDVGQLARWKSVSPFVAICEVDAFSSGCVLFSFSQDVPEVSSDSRRLTVLNQLRFKSNRD